VSASISVSQEISARKNLVSTRDIHDRIQDALVRTIANVVVFNAQVAEQLGLGVSDMQFMSYLQQEGPLSPGRLAGLSGLKSGSVTGVIDRLERAGYVHRERDESDRRKVRVVLNEERLNAAESPYAAQAANLRRVLGGFERDELDVIARFLERLNQPM
jgi:DNA-binding MarR family transcriptional regulator